MKEEFPQVAVSLATGREVGVAHSGGKPRAVLRIFAELIPSTVAEALTFQLDPFTPRLEIRGPRCVRVEGEELEGGRDPGLVLWRVAGKGLLEKSLEHAHSGRTSAPESDEDKRRLDRSEVFEGREIDIALAAGGWGDKLDRVHDRSGG